MILTIWEALVSQTLSISHAIAYNITFLFELVNTQAHKHCATRPITSPLQLQSSSEQVAAKSSITSALRKALGKKIRKICTKSLNGIGRERERRRKKVNKHEKKMSKGHVFQTSKHAFMVKNMVSPSFFRVRPAPRVVFDRGTGAAACAGRRH